MTADQIKVWIKQMELYEQDRLGPVCLEVINILLDEIDNLTREVTEWHSVFGHLSKDADEAGNLINEGLQERDDELQRTRHSYNVLSNQYDDLLVKHNKMLFTLQDSKTNEQYYYNLWEAAEKRIVEVKKALYDTIRIHLVDDYDLDPEASTLKIMNRILKEYE